jgi:hypothetical protein
MIPTIGGENKYFISHTIGGEEVQGIVKLYKLTNRAHLFFKNHFVVILRILYWILGLHARERCTHPNDNDAFIFVRRRVLVRARAIREFFRGFARFRGGDNAVRPS